MKKKWIFNILITTIFVELVVIIMINVFSMMGDIVPISSDDKYIENHKSKEKKEKESKVKALDTGSKSDVLESMDKPSYELVSVDASYFDDALFIGDSRTVGLRSFGTFPNAAYFAKTGISTNSLFTYPANDEVTGLTLTQTLLNRKYKKIYIMLGVNDLSYGTLDSFSDEFFAAIAEIRKYQPEAVIYIQSILGITKYKEMADPYHFSNQTVLDRNERLKSQCDGKTLVYLDLFSVFVDQFGYLDPQYSGDGLHLLRSHYTEWCNYLLNNAIKLPAKDPA